MIREIVSDLDRSKSILFITGAGISADSGLPTYRGIGGLYNDEKTQDGIPIEEALSGYMFESYPELTWKYIYQIEESCRRAKYNHAHKIISLIEQEKQFERIYILTQNIDGFHIDAGSKNVIEIHGNLYDLECTGCGNRSNIKDYSELKEIPPNCSKCRSILRPQVVLFGEMLIPEKLEILQRELSLGFDMVFSIGTTSVFPYIAAPMIEASRKNLSTVEINPEDTDISHLVKYKVKATAKEVLSSIYQEWKKK